MYQAPLICAPASQNDKPDLAQEFKGLSNHGLAQMVASLITAKSPDYYNAETDQPRTAPTQVPKPKKRTRT